MDTHTTRSLRWALVVALVALSPAVHAQDGDDDQARKDGHNDPSDWDGAEDAAASPDESTPPSEPAPSEPAPSEPVPADAPISSSVEGLGSTQMCIDKEIADRLAIKRKRRGVVDRLYIKQARHEFSANGGLYVSDLFSNTYVVGGAYTYHMTETTAVEIGVAFTHENADTIRAIEDGRGRVLDNEFARSLFAESVLVWSPIYGKFRLGGSVMRFDMHFDAGVGVVDSPTSRGVTGVGGTGFKIFLGQPVALRLDIRDHVYRQELLEEGFIVNDISVTAGLSIFLPFRN